MYSLVETVSLVKFNMQIDTNSLKVWTLLIELLTWVRFKSDACFSFTIFKVAADWHTVAVYSTARINGQLDPRYS